MENLHVNLLVFLGNLIVTINYEYLQMKYALCVLVMGLSLSFSLKSEAKLANGELREALEKATVNFSELEFKSKPAMAIGVQQDGKFLLKKIIGKSNIEAGSFANSTTSFNLASVTKHFTAYAIYLLQDMGRLRTTDSITKYIPELTYNNVTIQQLIWQISGIASQQSSRYTAYSTSYIDGILNYYKYTPLANTPGEYYAYNNNNYLLLEIIIRRITGVSLQQFLYENVFQKLNMNNTFFPYGPNENTENKAYGYKIGNEDFVNVDTNATQVQLVGAGGQYSSMDDLAKWANFLMSSHSKTQMMFADGEYNSGKNVTYGSGLEVLKEAGIVSYEHGGTSGATSTYISYIPKYKVSIIVLIASNEFHQKGGAKAIHDKLKSVLINDLIQSPKNLAVEENDAKQVCNEECASDLSGVWFGELNGRNQTMDVSVNNGTPQFTFFDGMTVELVVNSSEKLIAKGMPSITVSLHPNEMTMWNGNKTMGQFEKLDDDELMTSQLVEGYFIDPAQNSIWYFANDGETHTITSPKGFTFKAKRYKVNLIGNTQKNYFFELNGDKKMSVIVGKNLRIPLVKTRLRPFSEKIEHILTTDRSLNERLIEELANEDNSVFSESRINRLGYQLLQNGRIQEAINLFHFNATHYKNSINALDSLAEAYYTNNDFTKAEIIYKKILTIDPSLSFYKNKLDGLTKL